MFCLLCVHQSEEKEKVRNREPEVTRMHEHMTNKSKPAKTKSQTLVFCPVVGVRKQGWTRARDTRGQKDRNGPAVGDDVYQRVLLVQARVGQAMVLDLLVLP